MPDYYPEVDCPACQQTHNFCYDNGQRRPPGATYEYTCPATRQVVRFTPPRVCVVVDEVPRGATPILWVSDESTANGHPYARETTTRDHAPKDNAAPS
jgi:hypothetical protein